MFKKLRSLFQSGDGKDEKGAAKPDEKGSPSTKVATKAKPEQESKNDKDKAASKPGPPSAKVEAKSAAKAEAKPAGKPAPAPPPAKPTPVAGTPAKPAAPTAPAADGDSGVQMLHSGLIVLEQSGASAVPPAKPAAASAPAVVEWGAGAQRPAGSADGVADWDDILARARAALPPKEPRPRRDE